jgi:hypothetical protein
MAHLFPNAWQCVAEDDSSTELCRGVVYSDYVSLEICRQTYVFVEKAIAEYIMADWWI